MWEEYVWKGGWKIGTEEPHHIKYDYVSETKPAK